MSRTAAAVSAILLLSGAAAFAGAPAPPPAIDKAQAPAQGLCVADFARFCSKVSYGGGRRVDCLARHENEVTPACKERLKILEAMIAFGRKQHERSAALFAKQRAEEAAEEKAAAAKKTTPQPAPK